MDWEKPTPESVEDVVEPIEWAKTINTCLRAIRVLLADENLVLNGTTGILKSPLMERIDAVDSLTEIAIRLKRLELSDSD